MVDYNDEYTLIYECDCNINYNKYYYSYNLYY
jgi:hypothetical protein